MSKIAKDIPRGFLPMIVLSVLKGGDKYGLEMISIAQEQEGFEIKQPSLYSALKRMEDSQLISSYWEDSSIGGKRHYYSLTESGKTKLYEWCNESNGNQQLMESLSAALSKPKENEFEKNYLHDTVLVNNQTSASATEEVISSQTSDQNFITLQSSKEEIIQIESPIIEETNDNKNDIKKEQQISTFNQNEKITETKKKAPTSDSSFLPSNLKNEDIKQSKPSFVQNNLFSEVTEINPKAANQHEIKTSKKSAPKQKEFNLEEELNRLIVKPKSFFDSIIENKQVYVANPELKVNEILTDSIESSTQEVFENTTLQEENNEQQEVAQTVASQTRFVKEKLPENKVLRVQKIQPPIFDIRPSNKIFHSKKVEEEMKVFSTSEGKNEVDKLELYFKTKNIGVKKYVKHASIGASGTSKMNVHLFRLITLGVTTFFTSILFVILFFALRPFYTINVFEQVFCFVVIGAFAVYALTRVILLITKPKQKISMPAKIVDKKPILFSYAISMLTSGSIFLLLYSFDYNLEGLLYKMILTFVLLSIIPFAWLSQILVNRLYLIKK